MNKTNPSIESMSSETFGALQKQLKWVFDYMSNPDLKDNQKLGGQTVYRAAEISVNAARGLIELEAYRAAYGAQDFKPASENPQQGYKSLDLKAS